MNSFVQSTDHGVSIIVSDHSERIPLNRDMKVGFDDVGGARVWVERRNGLVTCSASLPESTEPVFWRFDVSDDRVHTTHAPVPIRNANSLEKEITYCRTALNGKL